MELKKMRELLGKFSAIDDLINVAYAIDFYTNNVRIQAGFNAEIAKKYLETANLIISKNTGYVEGILNIGDLLINITLT